MFRIITYYLSTVAIASSQAWFDDIGYTALAAQEGASTPDGAGIVVGVVEASESGTNYTPDTGSAQFTGKTITDVTGSSGGISGHANTVSTRFFGNTGSIASGITTANFYSAGSYLTDGGLRTGETFEPTSIPIQPNIFTEKIMNHSYVSSGFTTGSPDFTPFPAATSEALKRFDYSLVRDNTLAVVGLNNGSATPVPALLAHNYNGITVGLTNGNHSTGATTTEGAGRVKPDLVAPDTLYTSYSTPMVSASAAVLLSSTHSTANYENITTQKAVLMAGATKEGEAFEGVWSRSDSQPLDAHYGAGEVNVLNSFNIQAAGEQAIGSANHIGWDYAELVASTTNTYTFTISPADLLTEFSAVLTWNREVENTTFLTATVSNLKLELTDSMGALIQLSDSAVDNVEHIYLNQAMGDTALTAGTYNLKVSSDDGDASDYSLAWRSELSSIPEPSSTMLLSLASFGFIVRRSKKSTC
ncbi:MAG: PEP-CTERM sorting domain-containing protein [Akkermansiaceae bacterium]